MAKVRLLDPTDSKRRLDRYELIGELASGGMATVFLGRLGGVGGFQRFVAIKRLHPHLAAEQEFIEMFLDEARLAAGIHHPHVVPILEVGESESGYYLVMEYIEGDTLARIMARSLAMAKPVPRPVLVRIVIDALAGLHAAHELTDTDGQPVDLVHRDVSPQNILVGVDGCSRITDFGVAHAASRLSNTRADKLKGKLAYMSPEQARAAEVDRRADVFAMGIILWEVLAQKRLFKAEHEAITLQRVLVEPIPRLAQVAPSIHPAFDQVCAKALERDPSRRYQSAAEMSESLERAARTAASTSPTDLGVASPREVAAYVQGALGEDIAAQRESVRAWLAHSEPNLPRMSVTGVRVGESLGFRPAPDVTVKVPLDKPGQAPPSSPGAPLPAGSAPVAPGAVAITNTPRPSMTPVPATLPSMQEVVAGLGAAGGPAGAPSGDGRPSGGGRKVSISSEALEAAIAEAGDMAPHEGIDDDDDEHETLLMDRESGAAMKALGLVAASAPPAAGRPSGPSLEHALSAGPTLRPGADEPAAASSFEALAVTPPPPRRTPLVVAALAGLTLVVGAGVLWQQLRGGPGPATPAVAPSGSTTTTPTPAAPRSAAPVAPSAEATGGARPQAAEPEPATPVSALPPVVPYKGPPLPGGKGKAKAPEVPSAKPAVDPPKPPPPDLPPPSQDEANPYR